jgi:hypothetical protein
VNPFERFSEAAKSVLGLAQEEARRARHNHIGTEHLLVAMLRVEEGLAAQVLVALGVGETQVREALVAVLGKPSEEPARRILPTTRVKKIIELAFEESNRASRRFVTTGDVLVANIVESHGLGSQVLANLGVREVDVRAELGRLNLAGVREDGGGGEAVMRRHEAAMLRQHLPMGEGSRVLVHEPEPPHRLWEGRVIGVDQGAFEVEVLGRPAGSRLIVGVKLLHPVPTGPTFMCEYCLAHL